MASFKTVVRGMRNDGLATVYIRITHKQQIAYIKTDKMVAKSSVDSKGEIRDVFVNSYCSNLILQYAERLNRIDCSAWSAPDVRRFLEGGDMRTSFTEYAMGYIANMINRNQDNNAGVYKAALTSLRRFVGHDVISFKQLTGTVVERWIQSLQSTRRAKSLYPVCLRQVYRHAQDMLGSDAGSPLHGVANPWRGIEIPGKEKTEKRPLSAEECREFFSASIRKESRRAYREELGRDVAMLTLCLAGINTVDLYNLRKKDFTNGIIHYSRSKTKGKRTDEAYFEMRVHPILLGLFDKYAAPEESEYLFWFAERYRSPKLFNVTVNSGIKNLCEDMGLPVGEYYSAYSFRRTWATTAQNDCGATIPEVGFGLNHAGALSVTRGYIKIDFTPAWELNEKVVEFIFFSTAKSKQAQDTSVSRDKQLRVSSRTMVYARAYFRGEVVAEVSDIGFASVDEVIARLALQLPDTIPTGCAVHYRIKDVDADREAVYERIKG